MKKERSLWYYFFFFAQGNLEPMLAEVVREQALTCISWLRTVLQQPFDGPTVAVTHFAPSLASADPRYGLTPGTAGFCNALDDLLPLACLWLHGHLHAPSDYLRHGCRVVANPLGYARKGEQVAFEAQKIIRLLTNRRQLPNVTNLL